MDKDFYAILGVDKKATHGEVKKAYRKMAVRYRYPDKLNDPGAKEEFKEIAEAYDVLSDCKYKKQPACKTHHFSY